MEAVAKAETSPIMAHHAALWHHQTHRQRATPAEG
jgi:hypothetical protein